MPYPPRRYLPGSPFGYPPQPDVPVQWFDDAAGPMVRPYAMTKGRTRPSGQQFDLIALVVDAKSPWTFQHSTRVAELSVGIAEEMQCPKDVQRDVRRAALLHDLGKLGVSNAILDKPGKPTDEEFAQIRKHPYYTHQILAKVEAFQTLAEVAGAHHERLDGRGYFLQRQGNEITSITRILTVADIAEAMSAARPYRTAMSWERVLEIM